MMRIRRLAALTVLFLTVGIPPAQASCLVPPPMAEGLPQTGAVFSGLVEDIDFDGRLATVAVDRVWKGDVASLVQVQGSFELVPGQMTSIDRFYNLGSTYLFFVTPGGVGFIDDACTLTAEATAALLTEVEQVAGGTGSVPVGAPDTTELEAPTSASSAPILVGTGSVLVLAALAIIAKRRRTEKEPEVEGFRLNRSE